MNPEIEHAFKKELRSFKKNSSLDKYYILWFPDSGHLVKVANVDPNPKP